MDLYKPLTPGNPLTRVCHRALPANSGVELFLDPSAIPSPPGHLLEYDGETAEVHIQTGEREFTRFRDVLASSPMPLDKAERILDFGCSNARVTRWLMPFAQRAEVWGTDIQSDKIAWAMEQMSPPLHFLVNTIIPHLPFRDGYFSIISAMSVFTHITDLHGAWLMELLRLVKSGGLLVITLHDELTFERHGLDVFDNTPFKGIDHKALENTAVGWMNPYGSSGLAQTYFTFKHLERLLPQDFKIIERKPDFYSGAQTGYLIHRFR